MHRQKGKNLRFKEIFFKDSRIHQFNLNTQNQNNLIINLHIYNQNLSGSKSNVIDMNNKLSFSDYDIFTFQETWFDNTIDSNTLINGTDYTIYRKDRSSLLNNRSKGGGLATLIKKKFTTSEIHLKTSSSLEWLALRIDFKYSFLIILNIYLLPYRINSTKEMIRDLIIYLKQIP